MLVDLKNWLIFQKDIYGEEIYIENFSKELILNKLEEKSKNIENIIKEEKIYKIEFKKSAKSVNLQWYNSKSLDDLNNCIKSCMECGLGKTRKNFVFGVGNPNADILIIGEAPGADEDEQGEPFVGRAGQLLNKMLEAIDIKRSDVYIANIIKCRPPNNRRPTNEEINECEPYLHKQIELIKPKIILALGLTAVNSLLKMEFKMSDIRGNLLDYRGIKLIITYHPAALLRNPAWKRAAWEDLKLLKETYSNFINK